MAEWVEAGRTDDIPAGTHKVISTDAGDIAIFNLDGEFYAIEDVCTHDGGELASGRCEGDQVICPRHGARFCIRTGKVLSPPACEDVETFPVHTDNGMIFVDIDG